MSHPVREGKVQVVSLQYPAAYHCNLRCADCSHISPFSRPRLGTPAELAADLERLSGVLHAAYFDLLGGEPLLNPELTELARLARASGIADVVSLSTNGLLLHTADEELWRHVDEVRLTVYPDAAPSREAIEAALERAETTNTFLGIRCVTRFRASLVTRPHRSALTTWLIYHSCHTAHLRQCHLLSDGRLYQCSVAIGLADYHQRLGREGYDPRGDGLDIHASSDLLGDVRRYLRRAQPLECCRYCLGTVGRMREHRQLTAPELDDPGSHPVSGELDAGFLVRSLLRRVRRETLATLGRPLPSLRRRRSALPPPQVGG